MKRRRSSIFERGPQLFPIADPGVSPDQRPGGWRVWPRGDAGTIAEKCYEDSDCVCASRSSSRFVMSCCNSSPNDLRPPGISMKCVLRTQDFPNWLPDENAPDVVEKVVKERVFTGNARLLQRIVARSMFRKKSPLEVVTLLRKRGPKDMREQQEKVARAQALVFTSPVWFVGFPAILKGWIGRVFYSWIRLLVDVCKLARRYPRPASPPRV